MANFKGIAVTIIGCAIGSVLMSSVRSGISAARQCDDLSRGAQIELPSGRIMTCQ
jgi:hypothetical protein